MAIGEFGDKTGGDRPREHCILVYSRFGLYSILVYSRFGLYSILVYSRFGLYSILVYSRFGLDRLTVYFANFAIVEFFECQDQSI